MKPKRALLGLFVVCQFSTGSTQAATYTWDSNNTGAPIKYDGTGTWTTANNFYNDGTSANITWPTGTAVTDIASFGNATSTPVGISGAITFTSAISAGGMTFNPHFGNNTKYNISGGTGGSLQLNGTPVIAVNTNAARPFAAINGILAGTAGYDVTTSTAGILEIGTQANTITGTIRLKAGSTLSIGSDSSLGGAGSGLTFDAASTTLLNRGTYTVAAARPITIGAGNTARIDSLNGVTLTLSPTGGITGAASKLQKEGLGGLTLATGNAYTGQTGVRQGTLTLNFANVTAPVAPTNNIINSASDLRLYGGTLAVTGLAAVANNQTFAGLTLDPGASGLTSVIGSGGTTAVNFGAITRNAGSTLNLATIAAGTSYTTSASNNDGILGGYATVNNADWATVSGGALAANTVYQTNTDATTWLATDNVSQAATPTVPLAAAAAVINSLKLTAAADVVIGSGNSLTLDTGGLLVTGTGAENISGGTLMGSASGDLAVIQNSTAATTISSVIANNGGATALTKSGSGSLVLSGANTYSGNVFLNAGSLDVNSDAALGSGTTVTSRVGTTLTLSGGSAISSTKNFNFDLGSNTYGLTGLGPFSTDVANFNVNVTNTAGATISGAFNVTAGTFIKKGAGTLTLTNSGTNQLGRINGGFAVTAQDGGLTLNGGAGSVWNVGQGEFTIGDGNEATKASSKAATVTVLSGAVTTGSWTSVGRGNGTTGLESKIVMSGGSWDCGSFGLGFANGVTGYNAKPKLDLSGNAIFTVRDIFEFGNNSGSDAVTNVAGMAQVAVRNNVQMGMNGTAKGTLNLSGSGSFTTGTYVSVGLRGVGIVNVQDTASLTVASDLNITDLDAGTATMNISGGTVRAASLEVGKGGNVAGVVNTNGVINQTGGSLLQTGAGSTNEWRVGGYNGVNDSEVYGSYAISGTGILDVAGRAFQVGAYGRGVLDVSGTAQVTSTGGTIAIGRFGGGIGLMNMSGGTVNQLTTGNYLIGEQGTGTFNMSAGILNIANANGLRMGHNAGAGQFNFNGGTMNAPAITRGTGTGDIYLNGGLVKASAANANFMTGLTRAIVGAGGAKFDTNTFNITVAQPMGIVTGSGVTAIAAGTSGAGYMGQPIVQITGGGGLGASAIATMSGGTVTGYVITNPGTGYTSAPTIALVGGGATTAAVPGAPTTGAVAADGGLAKSGAGTLTLSGANTYVGGTTVTAGTLALGATNVLADAGAVTLTGADLNIGGFNDTVGAFSLTNGNIAGTGTLTAASFAVSNTAAASISPNLSGTGANFTKTGAGDLALTGNNTYTGTTSLGGGTTSLGTVGALDAGSSLSMTSAGLDLRNGTANRTQFVNNLSLNSGTLVVGMAGGSTDVLSATGTTTTSGSNTIKLFGSANIGTYDILTTTGLSGTFTLDTSAVLTGYSNYSGAIAGGNVYRITVSGNATPGDAYWKGDVSALWSDATFAPSNSNWATDSAGGTDTQQLPGGSSNVYFSATGAGNTTTTLGADFSINSLTFEGGSASVIGGVKMLTILGTNVNDYRIEVASGASANLNATTNNFIGNSNIQNGGTLTFSGGNLGSAANGIIVDGTLNVNADLTKGTLSGSGTISKSVVGVSTFTAGDANFQSFSGNIQNAAGTLNITKAGTGQMLLSGTANNFTGALKIAGGKLEIDNTGALLSPSSVIQQPGSTFINSAGTLNITVPYTFDLNGGVAAGVVEPVLGGGDGNYNLNLGTGTTTLSGLITNSGGSVTKRGSGTLAITSPGANVLANVGGISFALQEGDMILNGGAAASYAIPSGTGELTVGDNSPNQVNLTLSSGALTVGQYLSVGRGNGTSALQSTLNLNGGTLAVPNLFSGFSNGLSGYNARPVINFNGTIANVTTVRIAESGGGYGTLNLNSGGLTATGSMQIGYGSTGVATCNMPITVGNLQVGAAGNGVGAFYNNNVITSTLGASTANFPIGNGTNSYGYFRSNTGSSASFAEIGVGGAGGGGAATSGGVLDIVGGSVTATAWLTPNRSDGVLGQTCLINVTAGTLNTPNSGQFRVNTTANADQHGVINVSGTGSIIGSGAASTMNLNSPLGNSYGMLTIGTGGTVQLTSILSNGDAGHAIVNFNGGILKSGTTAPALLASTTTAYIQSGGATINTNTFDSTIQTALLAPANVGITSIALNTPGAGYVGRPLVRITGDGVGATAVADFDPVTGAVSGITVTSPGSGYNLPPTVTLIGGGGTTTAVVGTVTTALAATNGALTKTGTGTLTLSGINSYTGNTTVSTGGLTLADNAQLKFKIGANGVNNSISGSGTATLEGDFLIDTSGAALANGNSWTLVNVGTLAENFTSNFTVINFVETANVWTKIDGANTWTFSEATGVLSLSTGSTYDTWASSKGLTGAPGFENGKGADPDKDGRTNFYEFGFDGNPLNPANDGKVVGKIATVGGNSVLTLTVPVRTAATFSDDPTTHEEISALIDGVIYHIQGADQLATWTNNVTEVTGTDATTIQTGLPALSTGWTYRTFRVPTAVSGKPADFMRARVNE